MFCFETGVERKKTNCEKWDAPFVGENVIPMWVADMDFEIAPKYYQKTCENSRTGSIWIPVLIG